MATPEDKPLAPRIGDVRIRASGTPIISPAETFIEVWTGGTWAQLNNIAGMKLEIHAGNPLKPATAYLELYPVSLDIKVPRDGVTVDHFGYRERQQIAPKT